MRLSHRGTGMAFLARSLRRAVAVARFPCATLAAAILVAAIASIWFSANVTTPIGNGYDSLRFFVGSGRLAIPYGRQPGYEPHWSWYFGRVAEPRAVGWYSFRVERFPPSRSTLVAIWFPIWTAAIPFAVLSWIGFRARRAPDCADACGRCGYPRQAASRACSECGFEFER